LTTITAAGGGGGDAEDEDDAGQCDVTATRAQHLVPCNIGGKANGEQASGRSLVFRFRG